MFTLSLPCPAKPLQTEHWPPLCATHHLLFQMTSLFHNSDYFTHRRRLTGMKCRQRDLTEPVSLRQLVSTTGALFDSILMIMPLKRHRFEGCLLCFGSFVSKTKATHPFSRCRFDLCPSNIT